MKPLPIPIIPVGDLENTALVILPDLDMDKLETVSFDVHEKVLQVTCRFDETHEEKSREYPVKITQSNRRTVESMEKIAVMDAEQVKPDKLTSHPEERKKLENLMTEIKSPGSYTPLETTSTNGTGSDDPRPPGDSAS